VTIGDFQNGLQTRVQIPADVALNADDRTALISAAITRYSKDRPREIVTDIVGNATNILPLPTDLGATFEEKFSEIRSIEYPVGSVPPTTLDYKSFQMYRQPSGLKLMLIDSAPPATDTLRVTWTARHKADGTTVPSEDFDAVCDLTAALGCEAIAAFYGKTSDSTISADSVNYRTKSQEWAALGKMYRSRYDSALGISTGAAGQDSSEQKPAISMGDIDNTMESGANRITHGRRR
jgi:hypothetical protein